MKWVKRLVLVLLLIIIIGAGWLTVLGYQRYKEAIDEVPLAEKIEEVKQREDYTPLDQISPDFVNAVVAVEDRRFYTRHGVDVISLGRALLTNLITGEVREGGSTIPQQLAKNLYFTHKPSLTRKIAEVFFLYELEANYSKDEILSFYVNVIYYGDGHYGIAQASRGYFDKEPAELTLAEATLLAGLPQSPSRYQLSSGKELALQRQQQVLEAMQAVGLIDSEQSQAALEWSSTYLNQ